MTRLNKYICSSLICGLMAFMPCLSAYALGNDDIVVFLGPQSLSPRETISVTVQTPQSFNGVSKAQPVELIYTVDGFTHTLTGTATHGLVSFDVAAQDRAGTMTFYAKASEQISRSALVSVVPGPPQNLPLEITPSHQAGVIMLSSDVITDAFGNAVSDQTLMHIQWIDETGLVKSQNTQLFNGRIHLNAKCPPKFSGELKVQALLKSVQFSASNISALCLGNRG